MGTCRWLTAALLFAACGPVAVSAADRSPTTAPATRPYAVAKADVDRVVQPLLDGQWCAGVVVGVLTPDGRHVYGYGRGTGTDGRPPGGDTVYEIGSASKVFTSLLLAGMVVEGKVSLDDPVQKYLPGTVKVPHRGEKPVTLEHLATHTSGLPRMPDNFKPKDPANPYADYTVGQMYEFLNGCQPARAPGEGYEYSNLGAGLLGHVVSLRAGKAYEDLLVGRIAGPLGMSDTRITLTDGMRRRLAPGHDADGSAVANWDIPTFAGAGAIRSTADDLLKFLSAQAGLTNTDPDLAKAIGLTHRRRAAAGGDTDVALGWHMNSKSGVLWHNGQTGGYHSFLAVDPASRAGVVVLANTATGVVDTAGNALMRRLLGRPLEPPPLPPTVAVDRKVLDEYAGQYLMGLGLIVTVTREEDRLYAQLTGQPRFRIYPESQKTFYWRAVAAKVDFVDGADGKVAKLVLHQNGRDMPALRMRPDKAAEGERGNPGDGGRGKQ